MPLIKILLTSLLIVSGSLAQAAPKAPIYIASTIPYTSPATDGRPLLEANCPWDERLLAYLASSTKNRVVVTPKLEDVQGQKIVLQAKFGPIVTGKDNKAATSWIEVTGTLFDESGKPLGDFGFRDDRYAGYLHECKRAIRLSEGLGDSVAEWLEEPSPGVKIAEKISTLHEDTIDPDIKQSCPWDTELNANLINLTSGQVYRAQEDFNTAEGRKLAMTIVSSRMLGGGIYTGFKWMKVVGSLTENGRETGSFIALRHSFRAWTGCGMVTRLNEKIASDIAKWLKKPTMNARLGDADASTDANP